MMQTFIEGRRFPVMRKGPVFSKEVAVMKRYLVAVLTVLAVFLAAQPVWAAGTPVNTVIANQATADYLINSNPLSSTSNTVSTAVAEVIDVVVVWQDSPSLVVSPGDTDQALAFLMSNTGNGAETFDLSATSTVPGDDFDPVLQAPALYADTNTNGVYDAGTDLAIAGSTVTLNADEGVLIFVVSNIPAGISTDGFTGDTQLTVTSQTAAAAGTTPGSGLSNGGDGGAVDAVVGSTSGTATVTGTYQVFTTQLTILKNATVSNAFGGTEPIPGATITYDIIVTVSGSGQADSVVVTDPIPGNTTYSSGTLAVNPGPAVSATVGGAPLGVAVDFGTLDSTNTPQTITFDVTID